MNTAQVYASVGLQAIPLKPASKRPYQGWRSTPPGEQWRKAHPDSNTGLLATGRTAFIDCDDNVTAEFCLRALAGLGFEDAPVSVTLRGLHIPLEIPDMPAAAVTP